MGLIEKRPNIKLNVNIQLHMYISTREQNDSHRLKCIIVYIFYGGKEIAPAVNVTIILKQKLHHFINCNISNGVQHVNNNYEQPKPCHHA